MEHFRSSVCNAVLDPAEGDEKSVSSLHVQQDVELGYRCVRSFWRPTADELVALLHGGCIRLTVLGRTHAPLRVETMQPDTFPDELSAVKQAVSLVVKTAEQSGYEVRVWQQPLPPLAMRNWRHAIEVKPRFKRVQDDPSIPAEAP